jgi:hypothetical protein
MGQIAVVLDRYAGAHQAAYLSYHLAARSGSDLLGIAVLDFQPLEEAEMSISAYLLGARAAGLRARPMIIPSLTDLAIEKLAMDIQMVILGLDAWSGNLTVKNYVRQSSRPVWLVQDVQHNLRRALIIVEDAPSRSAALSHGLEIRRRWNVDLKIEEIKKQVGDPIFLSEMQRIQVPVFQDLQFDRDRIGSLISSKRVDLVMMDRETLAGQNWDLAWCANCVVAVYPPMRKQIMGERNIE